MSCTNSWAEVDEGKVNPLISGEYPVGDCATMPGRTGRQALLFTFVAFSGDNATDEKRPAAMPDSQSGGRRRE
jgi:hypothetical protein